MTRDADAGRLAAELIDRLGRLLRAEGHGGRLNPAQWDALRYLLRCNRFSNTPGALARYLNATKGTVSQTLNALERKGLVARRPDAASGRVVRLTPTAAGRALAGDDPLLALADAASALKPEQLDAMTRGLSALLARVQDAHGLKPFGICRTCRHFRPDASGGRPHWCALLTEPLSAKDSLAICAEHEPRAA